MRTELHVGDRVEVDGCDYRGTITAIDADRYEVTPDDPAHVDRDGKPYRWPGPWVRKLTTLELIAEAAV